MRNVVRPIYWAMAIGIVVLVSGPAQAVLLYSDLFEYYDDGTIIQNDFLAGTSVQIRGPGGPTINGTPTGALLLKIEEDVIQYDPVVHPFVTPGQDRYVYTISNLGFDSGNVPLTWGTGPGTGEIGCRAQKLVPFDFQRKFLSWP